MREPPASPCERNTHMLICTTPLFICMCECVCAHTHSLLDAMYICTSCCSQNCIQSLSRACPHTHKLWCAGGQCAVFEKQACYKSLPIEENVAYTGRRERTLQSGERGNRLKMYTSSSSQSFCYLCTPLINGLVHCLHHLTLYT